MIKKERQGIECQFITLFDLAYIIHMVCVPFFWQGAFLGKTVQVVPHITNEIIAQISEAATNPIDTEEDSQPDICMNIYI